MEKASLQYESSHGCVKNLVWRRLCYSLRKDSRPGLVDKAVAHVVEGSEDAAAAAAIVVPFEDRLEASAGRSTKEEQKLVRVVVGLVEDMVCDSVVQDKYSADVCSLAVT
jgi:hypothetical protein